jgi:hypothetical protein
MHRVTLYGVGFLQHKLIKPFDFMSDIIELKDGSFIAVGQEPLINPIDSTLPYKYQGTMLKLSSR